LYCFQTTYVKLLSTHLVYYTGHANPFFSPAQLYFEHTARIQIHLSPSVMAKISPSNPLSPTIPTKMPTRRNKTQSPKGSSHKRPARKKASSEVAALALPPKQSMKTTKTNKEKTNNQSAQHNLRKCPPEEVI
jgi:hypothetical protein